MKFLTCCKHRLPWVGVVLLAFAFVQGCNTEINNVKTPDPPSSIQGRVDSGNAPGSFSKLSAGVEGAVVTIAQLHANGALTIVSIAPAQTSSNGGFHIQTNLNNVSNLELIAEKNGQTWKAIVSGSVHSDAAINSRPLNVESTVEAEVYEEIVTAGDDAIVTPADVSIYISSALALQVWNISSSATNNQIIINLATAIRLCVMTQASALTNSVIGATQSELLALASAKTAAQTQLEASLYSAGSSQASVDIAYEIYVHSMVNVYSQTSISAESYAKTMQMSGRALLNASSSLNQSLYLELRRQVTTIEASSIRTAIEGGFTALTSLQPNFNAVVTTGLTLSYTLKHAGDTTEINSAFEAYHSAIITQLKLVLSSHSAAISGVDVSINADGGARDNLDAGVSSTINQTVIISTYNTFFTTVKSSVTDALIAASFVQINSTSAIVIMSNMNI